MKKFAQGEAISVRYRNRRIGEFLKEIALSEKKSTGITKVLNALKVNGSPAPVFETDSERDALFVTVYLHEGFEPIKEPINGHINRHINGHLNSTDEAVLNAIIANPTITNNELTVLIGKGRTAITRSLKKLREQDYIIRVGSNKTGYWEVKKIHS
jgi:ATP-dependent DNA helicase RecG